MNRTLPSEEGSTGVSIGHLTRTITVLIAAGLAAALLGVGAPAQAAAPGDEMVSPPRDCRGPVAPLTESAEGARSLWPPCETPHPSTTTVSADPSPATAGFPVWLSASIDAYSNPDGGSVAFTANGQPIPGCEGTPVHGATTLCLWVPERAYPRPVQIKAAYSGTYGVAPSSGTLAVVVQKAPQDIHLTTAPGETDLRDGPVALVASGGPSSTRMRASVLTPGVCALDGRPVTTDYELRASIALTRVGTCTVRLTKPGNASFQPATVDHTFQVIRRVIP